jgi:hypothetical protein
MEQTYQQGKVTGAAGHVQPGRLCWTDSWLRSRMNWRKPSTMHSVKIAASGTTGVVFNALVGRFYVFFWRS